MDSLPSRLLISLALLAVIAVFRTAKAAVDEANEARMQKFVENGGKRAGRVMWLLENRADFHAALHFIVLLAITALTAFVCKYLHFYIPGHPYLSIILSLLAEDALILIIGIYTPKKAGKRKADDIALFLSGISKASVVLLKPVVFLLISISNLLLRLMRINPNAADDEVTEEEIRMMVDMGSSSGAIDPEEKEMINNIFEFDDTPAKDIMTHRTDVEFLWLEDGIDAWDKAMLETNHSIYPVCGDSVDDIIGILNSKDFYRLLRTAENPDIHAILRPPFFIPESIKADELFRQMQKNKTHFAVVLDEYGGLGGIITISDLLEEIVGTLSSDTDENDSYITKLDANTWRIAGMADIDLVSKALGIELPVEEYNTFAGMILGELGTIPEDGSTPELETHGLAVRVTKIEDHRIEEAKVTIIDPKPAEADKKN